MMTHTRKSRGVPGFCFHLGLESRGVVAVAVAVSVGVPLRLVGPVLWSCLRVRCFGLPRCLVRSRIPAWSPRRGNFWPQLDTAVLSTRSITSFPILYHARASLRLAVIG